MASAISALCAMLLEVPTIKKSRKVVLQCNFHTQSNYEVHFTLQHENLRDRKRFMFSTEKSSIMENWKTRGILCVSYISSISTSIYLAGISPLELLALNQRRLQRWKPNRKQDRKKDEAPCENNELRSVPKRGIPYAWFQSRWQHTRFPDCSALEKEKEANGKNVPTIPQWKQTGNRGIQQNGKQDAWPRNH